MRVRVVSGSLLAFFFFVVLVSTNLAFKSTVQLTIKVTQPSAHKITPKWRRYRVERSVLSVAITDDAPDAYANFTMVDRVFFSTFASAVANEIGGGAAPASNYNDLIAMINSLVASAPPLQVQEKSKQMLVRLFPPFLLPAYKILFGRFTDFSAWMNTWVTLWATNWLMGPAVVEDLELFIADGSTRPEGGATAVYAAAQKQQEQGVVIKKDSSCLVIEKCRFLETAGCVQTCLHACKVPTQRFFYEEMGLPVQLLPNFTDYSCRFEFGVMPVPLAEDERVQVPCLEGCSRGAAQRAAAPCAVSGIARG